MRPVSGVLGVLRDLLADLGRGEPFRQLWLRIGARSAGDAARV
jgi:hypothetical protein